MLSYLSVLSYLDYASAKRSPWRHFYKFVWGESCMLPKIGPFRLKPELKNRFYKYTGSVYLAH